MTGVRLTILPGMIVLSLAILGHPKLRAEEYSQQGADGISAILTMGPESPNYSITLVRLLANYSF